MKKILLITAALTCIQSAHATDLLEVYQQALTSDPTYQQAVSKRLATKEGVQISLSSLLPNISLSYNPAVTRSGFSGTNFRTGSSPRNNTVRNYDLALTLSQTVFDYSSYMNLASAFSISSGADAILNSALQNLMIRVASAYFAVLKDEDNLSYSEASMLAYKEQLEQVKQKHEVGILTITDVYTARASYTSAVANYIAAETTLANDRENLRIITGKYYPHLSALSENFPLVSPQPDSIEAWVKTSLQQNWTIKSSQYAVSSARQIVKQQFGGHFPTVTLQGTADKQYQQNINSYQQALNERDGPSTQIDRSVMLNFTLPLVSGGAVVAQTNQATYNYEVAQQQLELTQRTTVSTTRQSYMGVIAGISQIKADREAVKSNISSLHGMEERYNVGAETLVNVLNQQEKLFQAQTEYAKDRYAYVNSILTLKQAAGTLGFDDLRAVNVWLTDEKTTQTRHTIRQYQPHKHTENVKKKTTKVAAKVTSKGAKTSKPTLTQHVQKPHQAKVTKA
jgi:outer membrane protein